MELLEDPVLLLDGADAWAIVNGRAGHELVAALQNLAARWATEAGWRAELVPAAEVALELGITEHAFRRRLARGRWPGEKLGSRWFAVPASSELAPPSPTCRPAPAHPPST